MSETAQRLRVEMAIHDRKPAAVARDAGIPRSTLSRILHAKQAASPAMVTRIESAIREPVSA